MFSRKHGSSYQEYKESPKEVTLSKRFNDLQLGDSSNDSEDRYSSPSSVYNRSKQSSSLINDQLINLSDCVICIEYCTDCKNNNNNKNNTKNSKEKSHNQIEYKHQANRFLRYCAKIVHNLNLNIRLGVIGIPSNLTNKNKVGAFEVSVIFKKESEVFNQIIHSKIDTLVWPSKGLLRCRLKEFFHELRVTCFESSLANKYLEFVPWETTALSNKQWKCAKSSSISSSDSESMTPSPPRKEMPSVKRRGNIKDPRIPIAVEWVWDFRNILGPSSDRYLFDPCLTLLPPSDADSTFSHLLTQRTKNKNNKPSDTAPPSFVEINSLISFQLDEEQLRLLGKRTSTRLLTSDYILRIPAGLDSLPSADAFSIDCFVLCERPKIDPFVTVYVVIRPKPSSPWESLLLQRHSFTIGSPEGTTDTGWLGNYEVSLLPDSAVVSSPSAKYHFFDENNDLLITHCPLQIIISDYDQNNNTLLHSQVVVDGTFDWPSELFSNTESSAGYYCLLIVSGNSFLPFSQKLCIVFNGQKKILLNKSLPLHEVCLSRKHISPVNREIPINNLLVNTSSSSNELIISSVPCPYELGEVVSFDISEDRLKCVGGLLQDLMARGKSTRIAISVDEKSRNNGCNYLLDALAIPYFSGKCATVKICITLVSDEWKEHANFSNYGIKGVHLGDLDGTVFETIQFEVLPMTSCRPPKSFQYHDRWRGRPVNKLLAVEVSMKGGGGSSDIVEVSNGLVQVPETLSDGEWTFSVHAGVNEFMNHHCKFVSYNNLRKNTDDDDSITFNLNCLLKPILFGETPDLMIVQSQASNLGYSLPKAIESGSVVEFLLAVDDDSSNTSSDIISPAFKRDIIDNKMVTISIEVIKETGSFFSTAVVIYRDDILDGKYAIVKFQVKVKVSEELSHSSYGPMKILIGCPNGSVFKTHTFHFLPSFSLALVPSNTYSFYNDENKQSIQKEVTISLFNYNNDVSHKYKVKGTTFKWPEEVGIGFWKIEISAKFYENFLIDQLIYFNNFLIDETCPISLHRSVPRPEELSDTDYLIDMPLTIHLECPSVMVCDQGYAFVINQKTLLGGGLYNRVVTDCDIVDLRLAIEDDDNNNDLDLYVEGLILFQPKDGLVVKLFLYCDNINNFNNFGTKTLLVADPTGFILSSHSVEIQPNPLTRLPSQIECRDGQTNIVVDKVICYVKSQSSGVVLELLSNESDGIVTINTTTHEMDDGVYQIVAFVVDQYLPYRTTFIKYSQQQKENDLKTELEVVLIPHLIRFVSATTITDQSSNKIPNNIPMNSVTVFPSHEEMFMDVVLLSCNGKPLRHMGSHKCNNAVSLIDSSDVPKECRFSCSTFIMPSVSMEDVDNNDLLLGAYSDCELAIKKGIKTNNVIKLNCTVIVRNSCSEMLPNFIDSGADIVKFKFIVADKTLGNTTMSGSFTSSTHSSPGEEHQLNRKTKSDGTCCIVLCPGKIDISLKADDDNSSLIHLIRYKPNRKVYTRPGEGRPHFTINSKDSSANSIIRNDQVNIPNGSVLVFPPSPEVYVDVTLVSDASITESVYLGTFRSSHFIHFPSIFDTFAESCEFHCSVFMLPQIPPSLVPNNDLRNGLYSKDPSAPLSGKADLSQIVLMKEVNITMKHLKKSTTLSSNFIDSGLDIIRIKVTSADKDLFNNNVTGTFLSSSGENGRRETNISKMLDPQGCLSLLVSEGDLSAHCWLTSSRSVPIRLWKSSRSMYESLDVVSLSPLRMNVFFDDCKKVVSIPEDHPSVKPVLVLMDKSISSSNDVDKMSLAKVTMKRLFKLAMDKKIPIALVAFDTANYYCCPGINSSSSEVDIVNETNLSKFRYLKMKDMSQANAWIDTMSSTKDKVNLGFALQDALKVYSECEDVYVITKGEVSPFTTTTNGQTIIVNNNQFIRDDFFTKEKISWRSFRSLYPKKKFNFISLEKGNEDNEKEICNMSFIGNGFYNCTKNN